jgi:hypothetical protein
MNHTTIDDYDFDLISEDGMDMDGFYERLQVIAEAEHKFIQPFIVYPPPLPTGVRFDIDQVLNEASGYYDEYRHLNDGLEDLYTEFRNKFKKEIVQEYYKRIFRNQIAEELIAAAMHPNRINKLIQRSDDIEKFFSMI